jgi:hypothetical protein
MANPVHPPRIIGQQPTRSWLYELGCLGKREQRAAELLIESTVDLYNGQVASQTVTRAVSRVSQFISKLSRDAEEDAIRDIYARLVAAMGYKTKWTKHVADEKLRSVEEVYLLDMIEALKPIKVISKAEFWEARKRARMVQYWFQPFMVDIGNDLYQSKNFLPVFKEYSRLIPLRSPILVPLFETILTDPDSVVKMLLNKQSKSYNGYLQNLKGYLAEPFLREYPDYKIAFNRSRKETIDFYRHSKWTLNKDWVLKEQLGGMKLRTEDGWKLTVDHALQFINKKQLWSILVVAGEIKAKKTSDSLAQIIRNMKNVVERNGQNFFPILMEILEQNLDMSRKNIGTPPKSNFYQLVPPPADLPITWFSATTAGAKYPASDIIAIEKTGAHVKCVEASLSSKDMEMLMDAFIQGALLSYYQLLGIPVKKWL